MEPAQALVGDPYPERTEAHEENGREGERRCSGCHVTVFLACDYDSGECGRKSGADNQHLEVERIHPEYDSRYEYEQGHHNQLEDRTHHRLAVDVDPDRREGYTGGKHSYRCLLYTSDAADEIVGV